MYAITKRHGEFNRNIFPNARKTVWQLHCGVVDLVKLAGERVRSWRLTDATMKLLVALKLCEPRADSCQGIILVRFLTL